MEILTWCFNPRDNERIQNLPDDGQIHVETINIDYPAERIYEELMNNTKQVDEKETTEMGRRANHSTVSKPKYKEVKSSVPLRPPARVSVSYISTTSKIMFLKYG